MSLRPASMRGLPLILPLAISVVHVLVLMHWQTMDSEYSRHFIAGYVLTRGSLPHNGVADILTITDAVNAGQY